MRVFSIAIWLMQPIRIRWERPKLNYITFWTSLSCKAFRFLFWETRGTCRMLWTKKNSSTNWTWVRFRTVKSAAILSLARSKKTLTSPCSGWFSTPSPTGRALAERPPLVCHHQITWIYWDLFLGELMELYLNSVIFIFLFTVPWFLSILR